MVVFTAEVSQNKYLPVGSTEVHAVVTITAADEPGPGAAAGAPVVEVILLDCSGSMSGDKIHEARRAAVAAIDALRDGVEFAVVAGTHLARTVYPPRPGIVVASGGSKESARQAVHALQAGGGTAIGSWLTLARQLMAARPDAIHHAILLTDGQNGEDAAELTRVLDECEGAFQCDCRGVGADWKVAELRRIATRLLGTVELLRRPEDIAADFRALIEAAMGREFGGVALRVQAPRGATVRFVRQVLPEVSDLTERATAVGELVRDYPTGAWGAGTRAYHLCVDVPPGAVGAKKRAAKVSLVVGDKELTTADVVAIWSNDVEQTTQIDSVVAHYTGQAELARALEDGLRARREGDPATASTLLGEAAKLAAAAQDTERLALLDKIVKIEDVVTGKVVLRAGVDELDEMDLDARSSNTIPAPRPAVCPSCAQPKRAEQYRCERCGYDFVTGAAPR
jgi:hypothetical protein